jgi:hypothetical protein
VDLDAHGRVRSWETHGLVTLHDSVDAIDDRRQLSGFLAGLGYRADTPWWWGHEDSDRDGEETRGVVLLRRRPHNEEEVSP